MSHQIFLRATLKKFGDRIVFKYKYCPDLNQSPLSLNAAKAVVAAEQQNKSEEMYQLLVSGNEEYTQELVFGVATKLGLNIDKFRNDFHSDSTLTRINRDIEDAKTSGLKSFFLD